jgi:hypothetical protein
MKHIRRTARRRPRCPGARRPAAPGNGKRSVAVIGAVLLLMGLGGRSAATRPGSAG